MFFTYNGVSSDGLLEIADVKRSILGSTSSALTSVSGRKGSYFMGKTMNPRIIELTVFFRAPWKDTDDRTIATTKLRELARWLHTEQPASLVLSDEPDKEYYAVIDGDTDVTELLSRRSTVLRFLCPDPHAYAIVEDVQDLTIGTQTISTLGNARVAPRVSIPITGEVGFLKLQNEKSYILLGEIPTNGEVAEDPYVTVLQDGCETPAGWSVGTNNYGGVVAGAFAGNDSTLSPRWEGGSFGTGVGYHGPVLRKALSEIADDFTIDMVFGMDNRLTSMTTVTDETIVLVGTSWSSLSQHSLVNSRINSGIVLRSSDNKTKYKLGVHYNVRRSGNVTQIQRKGSTIPSGATLHVSYQFVNGQAGRISLYALDQNGTRMASLAMQDTTYAAPCATMVGMIGDTPLVVDQGALKGQFNNMLPGILHLERINGRWSFYAAHIGANGQHYNARTHGSLLPVLAEGSPYLEGLGMIEIEASALGTLDTLPAMWIDSLIVKKKNSIGAYEVIARAGDLLEIDCFNSVILKNGKNFMNRLDFGSEFFDIDPDGEAVTLVADNSENIDTSDTTIALRPRWL